MNEDLVPRSFLHFIGACLLKILVLDPLFPLRISFLSPRFRVPLGREPQEVSTCEELDLRLELATLDANTA